MGETLELITVYQADDESAEENATSVCDALVEAGYTAVVVDDSDPEVSEGTFEVRVPADQAEAARAALAGDPSEDLDMVPLFEKGTELSDMEAMNIKALLEANGIQAVVIGAEMLPNLPCEIQVPRDQLEAAEAIVAEALKSAETAPQEDTTPQA